MVKVDIKKLPKETQQKLNELMPRVESKEIILEQLKKKHPKRYGTNPGLYEKLAEEENAREEAQMYEELNRANREADDRKGLND